MEDMHDPVTTSLAAEPEDGTGLCLSGGGYRAMLFHAGCLWRLSETGILATVTRVASVSGGSITSAVLALAWPKLAPGDTKSFVAHVVAPLRALADHTIDGTSVMAGVFLPGTIGEYVASAYRKRLFGDATLQDLPDEPRFIFTATNLETGALWRFSKPYNSEWRVGRIDNPKTPIADAVAASSAFPPVLSPFVLEVEPEDFTEKYPGLGDAFRRDISLTDGGVYDNLGLEPVLKRCRTVLVSDGGGRLADDPSPPADWARQSKRVLDVIDHQVRNLRKRQILDALESGRRRGTYWGIRTDIADYATAGALACPHEQTMALAATPTRLKRLPAIAQERLINWGYAVCDAAVRRYFNPAAGPPPAWPYPKSGVG